MLINGFSKSYAMTGWRLGYVVGEWHNKDLGFIRDLLPQLLGSQPELILLLQLNDDRLKERAVLINGFSKSYAMTGWRLGYAAAPHVIQEQMLKIHQFAIYSFLNLSVKPLYKPLHASQGLFQAL